MHSKKVFADMGTITKALSLLSHFRDTLPEIGLSEFVRLSSRDKATVHRHLVELEENGFLDQNPTTRAYRLGPALLRLAALREETMPTRKLIAPIVAELADTVGELVHFSLLQGNALSPVCHADPRQHSTQVHFDASQMLPLHATSSGLASLAFSEDALHQQALAQPLHAYTETTPKDPTALRQLIQQVRETGVAKLNGAFDSEVVSQAAPIFGVGPNAIGALSIAVPQSRSHVQQNPQTAYALIAAADTASRVLGGTFPHTIKGTMKGNLP